MKTWTRMQMGQSSLKPASSLGTASHVFRKVAQKPSRCLLRKEQEHFIQGWSGAQPGQTRSPPGLSSLQPLKLSPPCADSDVDGPFGEQGTWSGCSHFSEQGLWGIGDPRSGGQGPVVQA